MYIHSKFLQHLEKHDLGMPYILMLRSLLRRRKTVTEKLTELLENELNYELHDSYDTVFVNHEYGLVLKKQFHLSKFYIPDKFTVPYADLSNWWTRTTDGWWCWRLQILVTKKYVDEDNLDEFIDKILDTTPGCGLNDLDIAQRNCTIRYKKILAYDW